MVPLIRLVHGVLTVFFLVCIAFVYYSAITDESSLLLVVAVGALVVEGAIVVLNRGDCPLGTLHRRFGDETTFFELFLSATAAKLAVPFLGLVTVTGFLLLLLRACV